MNRNGPARARGLTRRQAVRLGVLLPAAGLAPLATQACAPEPPPLIEGGGSATDGPTSQDLQRILDRRAKAQLDGDEQAYLADLDTSNQAMVDWERMVFSNLRKFDLADVRFLTSRIFAGEPTDSTAEDSSTYRFSPVIKVIKLTADAGPKAVLGPGEGYEYTVAKRDDGWKISNIAPMIGEPAALERVGSASAPWNLDRLQVIRAGNVWLAADDSVHDLSTFAEPAQQQAREVEEMWGNRTRFPGHVLFFSRDQKKLQKWYDLGELSENYEGVQKPLFGVTKDGELYQDIKYAARMVIFLPSIEAHSSDPVRVMRHEMTHAVTARFGDPGVGGDGPPRWAIEGFARFIEIDGDESYHFGGIQRAASAIQSGRLDGSLPRSDSFYDGGMDVVWENYSLGYTVFAYVENLEGRSTAIDFYAEVLKFTEPFGAPLVDTPAFDGICQRVVGMGASELLEQWQSYVLSGG